MANGTEAIQLALEALGVGPGDEVVTSPLTAAFTALAVLRAGARPVFADVDPVTLNVSPEAVARAHHAAHAGAPARPPLRPSRRPRSHARDRAAARDPARRGRLPGHRARSTRAGRWARSAGSARCPSIRPRTSAPSATAGRCSSNDPEVAARLRRLRNGGQSDRYRHEVAGINSRLDEMQAAMLRVKLRHLAALDGAAARPRRRAIDEGLAGAGVDLPGEQPYARAVYHLFVVRHPRRDALAAALKERGIGTLDPLPDPAAPAARLRGAGRAAGRLPGGGARGRRDPVAPSLPRDDRRARRRR